MITALSLPVSKTFKIFDEHWVEWRALEASKIMMMMLMTSRYLISIASFPVPASPLFASSFLFTRLALGSSSGYRSAAAKIVFAAMYVASPLSLPHPDPA